MTDTSRERLSERISRRDALRGLALLGAGASTLGVVSACAPSTGTGSAPGASAAPARTDLVIGTSVEPQNLFSGTTNAAQSLTVTQQVNEKLVDLNAAGNGYEARLATSWRQVDPRTVELKLRPNVKFTNGEPFTAQSAKFSLDLMRKTPGYLTYMGVIQEVTVVDDSTVRVAANNPTLLLLPAMAMGSFQYPPTYYQQQGDAGFAAKPIGTGPFKFVEWAKGDHLSFTANTEYWNGAPKIAKLTFRIIPDASARLAALQAGEAQFVDALPIDSVAEVNKNSKLQTITGPSNRSYMLVLCTQIPGPMSNPAVRRALWSAVDVPSIITGLFKGQAKQLRSQILGPNYFGFDDSLQVTPYDPTKAKQLLAQAGYPDGFELTFKYPTGRYVNDKEVSQALAEQLGKVGVRLKQVPLESGTFLTQWRAHQLNDLFFIGYAPPPDAHFTLSNFLSAQSKGSSYFDNPALDALYAAEASTADEQKRKDIFKQISQLLRDQAPYVPLYITDALYAASKDLTGFIPRASEWLDIGAWQFK